MRRRMPEIGSEKDARHGERGLFDAGGARRRGTEKAGNAVTSPIFQTATYAFRDSHELIDYFEGQVEREEYGRYGNPTQRVAERKLAALEARTALLFASGMAAITTTLFAMLWARHVVVTDDGYRRTRQFLQHDPAAARASRYHRGSRRR